MLWRFSANNTHLYPGARLRSLDTAAEARLAVGDDAVVEFSDGMLAMGRLVEAGPDAAVLQMPRYRTQRGADVAPRRWRLVPGGAAGLIRVQRRLPGDPAGTDADAPQPQV